MNDNTELIGKLKEAADEILSDRKCIDRYAELLLNAADALEDRNVSLEKSDSLYTFGGESFIDGFEHAEYGIHFGTFSVYKISPEQLIQLVINAVDHLLINGHSFELRETGEQDQKVRLICTDEPSK